MGNPRCHWVRDRLPLLVGDDLRGLDRRRVERHLIGCPQCRQQHASFDQALETLRRVAATPPAPRSDAPSLWPALARQIRESRRPSPSPGFTFSFPSALILPWLRVNLAPAVGLCLTLIVVTGVSLAVRQRNTVAQSQILANRHPIARAFAPPRSIPPAPAPAPRPRRELPDPVEAPVVESSGAGSPAPRLDYDLENGRPMPDREPRDTKATY
jgi:anti-sigma factor RsiW